MLKAGFSGFLFPSINHEKYLFLYNLHIVGILTVLDLCYLQIYFHIPNIDLKNPKDFLVALEFLSPQQGNLDRFALFPKESTGFSGFQLLLGLHIEARALCTFSKGLPLSYPQILQVIFMERLHCESNNVPLSQVHDL